MYKIFGSLLITITLLSGCASTPGIDHGASQQARQYEAAGKYQRAADMYWLSAQKMPAGQGSAHKIKAAEMALQAKNDSQARAIVNRINESGLSPSARARKRLVEARMAKRLGNQLQVQSLLSIPLKGLPSILQNDIQKLLGQPSGKTSGTFPEFGPIAALIKRHSSTRSKQDAMAVWQQLDTLDVQSVSRWLGTTSDPVEKGWLELIYMQRTQRSPEALEKSMASWQKRYKTHPAWPGNMTASTPGALISAGQIAILIPRSGRLANIGQIILNGITTAQRNNSQQQQPRISVYDTGDQAENILQIYHSAVQQGADLVIGPMDKKAVDILARATLPVPVITLNHGNDETFNANLFQFALLPEDEARLTAERMIAEGHREIIAFVPDSTWGKRVGRAFVTRLQELGGNIVEASLYDATSSDYSESIKTALQFEKGEERHSGTRREDVDSIFLAAFPRQGRIFKPLLKFYFAEELPVYSTSHIYDGIEDKYKNRDLNEVKTLDIPWLLGEDPNPKDSIPMAIDLSGNDRFYPRLFAFGVDSFNLAPQVKLLSGDTNRYLKGYSGNIYLDANNRLHHRLLWAEFEKGVLRKVPMKKIKPVNADVIPATPSASIAF